MQNFWSSFDCIAEWKKKLIFIALLVGLGGILWETNDLISENRDHPAISPQRSLMNLQYDEYGDPIASTHRVKPLPFSNLITSPVVQVCGAFIITVVIGSLFRSLVRGAVTLFLLVSIIVLVVGQGSVIEFFSNRDAGSSIDPAKEWLFGQADSARNFLLSSLPSSSAAAAGLFVGLRK